MISNRCRWVWDLLACLGGLCLAGCAEANAPPQPAPPKPYTGPPRTVLLLESPKYGDVPGGIEGSILLREICRQAVSMAVREGCGLPTRDMALREPFPEKPGPAEDPIYVLARPSKLEPTQLGLTCGPDERPTVLSVFSLRSTDGEDFDCLELLEQAEELSRGALLESLGQVGFGGQPIRSGSDASLPDGVTERLGEMNFISQFSAVREIRRLIRAEGESPTRLAGLVRAYAHLGKLTEYHWNATPKVFKARALLYAQRLLARQPESAWALWHRAYASAWAGLHAAALEDLAAARQANRERADDRPRPSWVDMIDAHCRYDSERLREIAAKGGNNQAAALLLRFLTLEHCGTDAAKLEAAMRVLQTCPDCFRVIDAMCDIGPLGHMSDGIGLLAQVLPHRMAALPDCPQAVRDLLSPTQRAAKATPLRNALKSLFRTTRAASETAGLDVTTMVALAKALVEAGSVANDAGEPSWSVLGRMIQEVFFTQTARHAWHRRARLSAPTDQLIDRALPLVAEHPYRRYIESLRYKVPMYLSRTTEICTGIHIVDANHYMQPLFMETIGVNVRDATTGLHAWGNALSHTDGTAPDLEKGIVAYRSGYVGSQHRHWAQFARRLHRVSPYAPLAIAVLIEKDWKFAKEQAEAWEKQFGNRPMVKKAFARHYMNAKQPRKAESYLKWCMDNTASKWAFETLAESYRKRGDEEKWAETLAAFLQKQDRGLDAARIQSRLANYLMDRKEWAEALPYAVAAAECWTASGLRAASRCYEGLKQWDESERWIHRLSERYESSAFAWYFWCRRTGRGDVARARSLITSRIAGLQQLTEAEYPKLNMSWARLGVFYLLEDSAAEARRAFERALHRTDSPYNALHLALIADAANDAKARDAALAAAIQHGFGEAFGDRLPEYAQLAPMFVRHLDGGPSGRLEPDALDRMLDSMNPRDSTIIEYFIGRFLQLRGDPKTAVRYLRRAATSDAEPTWNQTLACVALRKLGVPFGEATSEPAAE